MNNPLPLVPEAKIRQTKLLDIILERGALQPRVVLLDELRDRLEVLPGRGRDIMICCSKRAVGPAYTAVCVLEPFEGLRGGHFVHEMSVCDTAWVVSGPLGIHGVLACRRDSDLPM